MNKLCLFLSVLTGLCACSVIDSDSARTKPDFGKTNTSLRFDNREQYQDKWQTYLNCCSEALLAIGTAHAERGSKAHPDGLSPFYDALLNHPSEITAKLEGEIIGGAYMFKDNGRHAENLIGTRG